MYTDKLVPLILARCAEIASKLLNGVPFFPSTVKEFSRRGWSSDKCIGCAVSRRTDTRRPRPMDAVSSRFIALEILICPEGNLEESLLRGVISFEFAKEGTKRKRKANENDATF